MVEKKYGRIVNVSSTQSIAAEASVGAYAASKHAVKGFTDTLRSTCPDGGIDIVASQPGDFNPDRGLTVMENILQAQSDIDAGQRLFRVGCASCHGLNGEGLRHPDGNTLGPSLVGVGAAAVYDDRQGMVKLIAQTDA